MPTAQGGWPPLPQACCQALCLVLCLGLCLGLAGCVGDKPAQPKAVAGVLDLSAWSPERDGPMRLDGQWEARWGEPAGHPDMGELAELPAPWSRAMPGASVLRATGTATFRLLVFRPPSEAELALRLGNISAAWALWINGRQVASNGVPGADAIAETPLFANRIIPLHDGAVAGGPLELVLQVSNQHYREGGVLESLWLGEEDGLQARERRDAAVAMFLAGTLFIMGLYHVALHYFRRSDLAPLYLGLYCLLWMGCYLSTDSSAWAARLLLPGLPGLGLERFGLACLFLSVPTGYAFFRSLFPNEFRGRVQAYAAITGGAAAALALAGPPLWFSGVLPAYYLSSSALIALCLLRLRRAWNTGREGASFIFAGFLPLGLAGLNDMLTDMRLIASVPVLPLGMLLFVLGQAFALSRRLHGAFCAVEALSFQLESKNMSLEAEMEERGRLEREIINISEEERRRMSVDLHDGLCQLLTAARLRCAVLAGIPRSDAEKAELDKLSVLLDELVDSAYDLSHGLWPLEHGPHGAGPSLADMARRLSRTSGVPIAVTQRRGCESCDSGSVTQLFRIAQEALANAIKHAKPSRIAVDFRCQPGGLAELSVRDDGIGRARATPGRGGLGMGIMAHRARMIGGEICIEDGPEGGTIVRCTGPCHTPSAPRIKT